MTEPSAYLAHYPLSAALKAHAAGDPLPRWELHPVDVEAAQPWADMLHTLRRARPAVAFPGRADAVDKIAAPDERTANVSTVEQPAGEATSPASPATLAEFFDGLPDEGGTIDVEAATEAIRAHRDGRTYDVDRFGRPVLPPADEGDDADPQAVAVLKARYAALEGDGKAWVNAVAKQAQAAGGALSLADSQPQSIRRFEAMRGLVLLAEGGFADDGATRGILRPILGDVADMAAFSVGKLVAALTPAEAARFALLADTVANGSVSLSVKLDGRYEWEFAA